MSDLVTLADRRSWAAYLSRLAARVRAWWRNGHTLGQQPLITPPQQSEDIEAKSAAPEIVQNPLPDAPNPAKAPTISSPDTSNIRALKRDVQDKVEEIIELFSRAERVIGGLDSARTYADGHDDLWACDYHLIDDLAERMQGYDRWYLLGEDANDQATAMWPVDVATIVWKEDWAAYATSRVSSVRPSEVRGKVTIVPPRMAILSSGRLHVDSQRWTADNAIVGIVSGRWSDIGRSDMRTRCDGLRGDTITLMRTRHDGGEVNNTMSVMIGAALTARYSWHVAFGSEDGPRLLLPTNPNGCLALFRDRAAPESGRRAALRHWVANHYRDTGNTNADLIYVRDHLRGTNRFQWRGLDCELLVSQYDLEKNEFFKVQAAEWRAQRRHNRVRLRVKERRMQ